MASREEARRAFGLANERLSVLADEVTAQLAVRPRLDVIVDFARRLQEHNLSAEFLTFVAAVAVVELAETRRSSDG